MTFFVYDLENAPVSVGLIPIFGEVSLRHVVMKQERPVGDLDTDAWGGEVVAFCPSKDSAESVVDALNRSCCKTHEKNL